LANIEAAPVAPQDVQLSATFAPVAQRVAWLDVQSGEQQRSLVNHLDLLFTQPDQVTALIASINDANTTNDRLKLKKFNLDGSDAGTTVNLNSTVASVGKLMSFNFGQPGRADGYYELDVDLDGNGTFDQALNFYRLQGDLNGDKIVDGIDMTMINGAFGQIGTGLAADLNGDGKVDQKDRVLLASLFVHNLKSGLALDD
jgi:hypothetical protein